MGLHLGRAGGVGLKKSGYDACMINWKVWFSDFFTFDSSQGGFSDVPPWDIQVIAERNDEVGRRLYSQADYYLFIDGKWVGVDWVGLIDYLVNVLKIVKVGRMIDRELFRQILAQAHNDPDLPPKSGWLQGEPRD